MTAEEGLTEEKKKKRKPQTAIDMNMKSYWIKASAGQTVYGYTGNYDLPPLNYMSKEDGQRQSLQMKVIEQHEVPEDVKKRLLKKSQQVISAVNKGSSEFDEHLTQEGPSIVTSRPEE